MPFRFSSDAKDYLSKLKRFSQYGNFKLDFDFYYLCAVLGMISNQFIDLVEPQPEIVRAFPQNYHDYRAKIIGLLIRSEVKRTGKNIENRDQFEKFILELVDREGQSLLSEDGEKILNKYAEGGFRKIQEHISSESHLNDFIISYNNLIEESLDNSDFKKLI